MVGSLKLVGFVLGATLSWGSMIDSLARKARQRLGALIRRLRHLLDDHNINMESMHCMFIRSILECGNVVYMGAAKSHLAKLDRVQQRVMEICNFEIDSLKSRGETVAVPFALDS